MECSVDDMTQGVLFSTHVGNDVLKITNSVFENIDVKSYFPIIDGIALTLK